MTTSIRCQAGSPPGRVVPVEKQSEAVPSQRGEGASVSPSVTPRKIVLKEKRYRSLLKAVSWRATGTVDTILISFLVTGKIKLAVSIGFIEVFTKIMLFYLHERLWHRISLGRAPAEDYSI